MNYSKDRQKTWQESSGRMRILIADDHLLVRAGIRQLIDNLDDFQVVGEASNNREMFDMLADKRPDIVLLDISMPDGSGLDSIQDIRKELPNVKILVLSMHSDLQHVNEALTGGADGFLVKDAAPAELELALKAVSRTQIFLSPSISNLLVEAWKHPKPITRQGKLSPRQQEILDLIAEGYSTREIADLLDLSIKTIETHRSRMVHSLGLKRGAELLRYALNQ